MNNRNYDQERKRSELASNSIDVDDYVNSKAKTVESVINTRERQGKSVTASGTKLQQNTHDQDNNHHHITHIKNKLANDFDNSSGQVGEPRLVILAEKLLAKGDGLTSLLVVANYEAHIYNLRAQTNYTFQVQVSAFNNEALNQAIYKSTVRKGSLVSRSHRPILGRLLDGHWQSRQTLDDEHSIESRSKPEISLSSLSLKQKAETKAFAAEATRCLADVSELSINTGRFFGGRISVEDSQDPRCQLFGNRSSEQSTYLFRIDHSLCKSKLVVSFLM